MGGGTIQLAARGKEDLFLTQDPQMTFFKVVYKRATNFTKEQIQQNFPTDANFGRIVNCTIGKNGDLMGLINIVVTLPSINLPTSSLTKFAWVKKVGFALIKSVSIIINDEIIDKHYSDWLNLWSELTGSITGPHHRGYNIMIGNVDSLTQFSYTKSQYQLFIPLQFWFCKSSSMALPLVSLQYSPIRINVEFEQDVNCYLTSPTHYITCSTDIVSFKPMEYIQQNLGNGDIRAGIFIKYDIATQRLYYYLITTNKLVGMVLPQNVSISNTTQIAALQTQAYGLAYLITGLTSGYSTFATTSTISNIAATSTIGTLNFVNCYLLIDYYYLDSDERYKFSQSRHDYLIEQLYYTPPIPISTTSYNANLITVNPCKLMVWYLQMSYIYANGDYFNYTDSYQNKVFETETQFVGKVGTPVGNNVALQSTILLNGLARISVRDNTYFEYLQQYQNTAYAPQTGINMYSYALYPMALQPSGSYNTSFCDNIQVQLKLSNIVTPTNSAIFHGYCVCHNIFRIVNGLGGVVFIK